MASSTTALAVTLFAATDIDDLFVLISFFADRKYRTYQIVAGQYLGFATLVAISLAASLVSLVFPPAYVGLLGLLPILMGLKKLYDASRSEDDDEVHVSTGGLGNVFAVAVVTIANGGDNIGIYTPVFATSTKAEISIIVMVFAVMVAIWLAFSNWLVNHPALSGPIRRYGHWLVPVALIAIGLSVLLKAGSFALLYP